MNSRIDARLLNTRKIHHEAAIYLLRLCANLKTYHENELAMQADPSTLEEWSTHRADLSRCTEPIARYGQYGHSMEGEKSKHSELILRVNAIVAELKLRNAGHTAGVITIAMVENIERMAMQLNCRERLVWY